MLSVTLFLIDMETIFGSHKKRWYIGYDDDFVLYMSGKKIKELEKKLKSSLNKLFKSSNSVPKSKCIVISRNKRITSLKIRNDPRSHLHQILGKETQLESSWSYLC